VLVVGAWCGVHLGAIKIEISRSLPQPDADCSNHRAPAPST